MFGRFTRALVGSAVLLLCMAQGALASSTIEIQGSFHESLGTLSKFGHSDHHPLSWDAHGAPSMPAGCPDDVINCGRAGSIRGYGRGRDEFLVDDGLYYGVVLDDDSSLLLALDFAGDQAPGRAGDALGRQHSYGNPDTLWFDATVVEASGQFQGATGGGTVMLHFAGSADQIDFTLTLELP